MIHAEINFWLLEEIPCKYLTLDKMWILTYGTQFTAIITSTLLVLLI